MTYPPSLSITNKWEAINKLRVVGMQQAERGCRKFRTGAIAWSQTWQLIRDKIEVWALVRRHKEGKKVSSRFLLRKIKSSGIENANTTLAEACEDTSNGRFTSKGPSCFGVPGLRNLLPPALWKEIILWLQK